MIHPAYPYALFLGIPLLLGVALYRFFSYKEPVYRFSSILPLTSLMHTSTWRDHLLYVLRFLVLTALCIALGRLREPDERSKVPVQGIDIMLVFDASGSMQLIDDRATGTSRIDSAREEARNFIKKRIHDPMGLVIFSGVAVTRCPLTLDKHMLDEIVAQTGVDTIPVDGTVISEAIIVAANRLKKSKAASRIMIVLTDGAPSPHDKSPQVAVELAKKLGIKIYTIGVGSPEGGWYFNAFFGWQQHRTQYNEKLLHYFAQETGGSSFVARNPEELEKIYATIDQLERSEHEMPQYAYYAEYFIYFLWIAAVLLALELLLATLWWVRL